MNKLALKYFWPVGLTIVLGFMLAVFCFHFSHGFDITDESFYLLWASQPGLVLASSTQFGFYTRWLYVLSGGDIALFRFVGFVVLLSIAVLFSFSLEQYRVSLSTPTTNRKIQWEAIVLCVFGVLVYYRSWLITPSYNWLALVSILLCGAGGLRFTTFVNTKSTNVKSYFPLDLNGLLVGVGGGIAFMAKPTTAFLLALTILYWTSIHPRPNKKKFLLVAIFSACLFLLFHASFFKGGIFLFYSDLRTGIDLASMLGAGQSVSTVLVQAFADIKDIPYFILSLVENWIVFLFFLFCGVWWSVRYNHEKIALYICLLVLPLFVGDICYQLWKIDYLSRSKMGLSGVTLISVLLFCALFVRLTWAQKRNRCVSVHFVPLVNVCILLFLLAASYGFGSANGLVRQMSGAYVFFVVGSLYIAFWIDDYLEQHYFRYIVMIAVVASVFLVLHKGFRQPYRLPRSMSEQLIEVSFLSGDGTLHVDRQTANYINDLKEIALNSGWKQGLFLVDLTGGSPGATVILGGKIVGFPWLVGGYKGSSDFVVSMLKMASSDELNAAWILTAPKGRRKLRNEILLELNVDFPLHYEAVGQIRTGYRNEIQVLWKPVE